MPRSRERRHQAQQWEFPWLEEIRERERMELPARGSLLRIAGCAPAGMNGVWKVKSALRIPEGVFLGLETPRLRVAGGAPGGERQGDLPLYLE